MYSERISTADSGRSAGGVLFGIFLHRYVITTVEVDAVMFGRISNPDKLPLQRAFITLWIFPVCKSTMHFKLKKINMVESFESVE